MRVGWGPGTTYRIRDILLACSCIALSESHVAKQGIPWWFTLNIFSAGCVHFCIPCRTPLRIKR